MSRVSQKRAHDASILRAEPEFGDYSRPLNYEDLTYLNNDGVPQPGFLSGRVVGTGFTHGVSRFDLEMYSKHSVPLLFEGEFASRVRQVAELGSNIRISTRGAIVEQGAVCYPSGAHVAIETVLDAWACEDPAEQRQHKRPRNCPSSAPRQMTFMSDDLWLNTQNSSTDVPMAEGDHITSQQAPFFPTKLPTPRNSSPIEALNTSRDSSPPSHEHQSHEFPHAARLSKPDDLEDSLMDDESSYAQDQGAIPSSENARTAKNREKTLRKRKKRAEKRRQSEIPLPSAQPSVAQEESSASQEVENMLRPSTPSDVGEPASASTTPFDTFRSRLVEGYTTNYHPIGSLGPNQKDSLIGVVTSVRGTQRATRGDRHWNQHVTLIDESNLDSHGGLLYNEFRPIGLSIQMFSHEEAWLPKPEPGDVLIVYNVKIERFEEGSKCTATGQANQFKWAIFRRESRSFGEIDLGDALGHHSQASYIYSPILPVGGVEQAYCEELLAWWDDVQQRRKEKKCVVQHIGNEPLSHPTPGSSSKPPKRKHQLIQDVNPWVQPFFDCTVEIIHVAESNDMTHVYVTDYTANTTGLGLRPVQTEWCPANLAKSVLQIEFFGMEAANFVREKKLEKGQFWSFCNVRMKPAKGDQYLEGNYSETRKAYQLEETAKEPDPRLTDLLIRKKQFEESNNSPHKFEHRTIGDAEVSPTASLFTCTVEVLNVSESSVPGVPAKIYVTDYTSRDDLQAPLSNGLREQYPDAILMVQLEDKQAERANKLDPGDIIRIQNVRAKTGLNDKVSARIGGGDNLIRKLEASSDDPHVVALLERKTLRGSVAPESPHKPVGKPVHIKVPASFARPRPAPNASSDNAVIGEILEDKSDGNKTFQLKAHVVDYEPENLNECIIRACTNCNEPVDANDPECPVCGNGAEHLEYRFNLTLTLADAPRSFGNDRLDVLATTEWAALSDLEPETVAFDADGVETIMARRLQRYLWHLKKDGSKKFGNDFEFVIERRRDADDIVQYHLLKG